jgi:4-(gamma-glutamylamino)butanal dehydrogenase
MNKVTLADWQQKAAALAIEGRAFIGGRYCDAHGARTFDCVSPIDGKVLAQVADCGEADVDAAVRAARHAFNEGVWCGLNPRQRKAILLRWAASMRAHLHELALI